MLGPRELLRREARGTEKAACLHEDANQRSRGAKVRATLGERAELGLLKLMGRRLSRPTSGQLKQPC